MPEPNPEIIQAGIKTGTQLADIIGRSALELTRRWEPDQPDYDLYIAGVLELSYFFLHVIKMSAARLLPRAQNPLFVDSVMDGLVSALTNIEDQTYRAPGFAERYGTECLERLAQYAPFPDVGVYDQYELYQFAFSPEAPPTADAFETFVQRLSKTAKRSADEWVRRLLRSQIEEAMDELKLNEQLSGFRA